MQGILLYTDASPYARLVRICLRDLALLKDVQEQHCHPFDNSEQHLQWNPLGKVPCLQLTYQDGGSETFFDSTLIAETLLEIAGEQQDFTGYIDRANKKLHYLAKGILDLAVFRQQEKLKDSCSEFWLQRTELGIMRSLQSLAELESWLHQQRWGVASATLLCALDYLDFRHPELQWQQPFAFLVSWRDGHNKRASVVDTLPKA